jgi:hypothetical protein
MSDARGSGQSGGISNTGTMSTGGGNIVGGNMTINKMGTFSPAQINNALQPIADTIRRTAPPEQRAEAEAKLNDLKTEVAKGDQAEDRTVAKLVKGLVALIPSAVSSVVSAFATPILGGVAGP